MPTAHKVLVKAGESTLCPTSAAATATSASDGSTKGRWSEAEHKLFLQGLEQHGRKWKKIAAVVETRTRGQIISHGQKYFAKLERLESAKTKETNGEDGPEKLKGEDEAKKKSWDERFQQLVEYKEQNGHSRVPQRYKANPELGSWVSMQRVAYRKQSGRKITEEQINRLEGIGFVWVLRRGPRLRLGWDERLEELKQYREVNGHCRVPQKYKANPQLGVWANNQRIAYKKGKLSTEQIRSLEDIGFKWVCRVI